MLPSYSLISLMCSLLLDYGNSSAPRPLYQRAGMPVTPPFLHCSRQSLVLSNMLIHGVWIRALLLQLASCQLVPCAWSCVSQVRPYLMADGGNVEFVEIDGLVVKLKLAGACGSCPSSLTTMTMGIKRRLMEKIPVRSKLQ